MMNTCRTIGVLMFLLLAGSTLGYALDIRVAHFTDKAFQPTRIEGLQFPKTLVDATGDQYLLEQPPQRIVSVTLGADEILSALVDSRRIVGVTYLADDRSVSNIPQTYPDNIRRIRGDTEEILALEPDLVFIASYTRAETVHQLLNAGVPVVRLAGHSSYAEIETNIRLVAQATGSEQQAEELLAATRQRADLVKTRVQERPRPRVLFYNLNGYTAGSGTLVDEMIEMAGGYNVAREAGLTGNQKIGQEMAIGLEPDIILLTHWSTDDAPPPSAELVKNPNWQQVPAIQNKRVYDLRGYWVLSVSHYSWEGITQIATRLHPEVFNP
ncbi:MAG: ABC transporter substrate-binding protein [Pseudomonadales bacterium]